MGKRGRKPKEMVHITWSDNFAYAIGLLVSDGNLSKDGRHIIFTTIDPDLVRNFTIALGIDVYIRSKSDQRKRTCYDVQFSDVRFYRFLNGIGIFQNKSKSIGAVQIPKEYTMSFVRGVFDGDGSVHSYFDKRWANSFLFYLSFASASKEFILWLQSEILRELGISGHIVKAKSSSVYQLRYAKQESVKLQSALYPNWDFLSLKRKRLKIMKILSILSQSQKDKSAQVVKLVDTLP
ncbi:MAG: LAGLIDADG family homing endonuclease [Candidatus Pacebacteria bacterium]|nr:LAGLIDADG family homing endonuclease [Candidatus Paceibacterota bacterium]